MEKPIRIAFAGLFPIQVLLFLPAAMAAGEEVGPVWTARHDGPSFGMEGARRIGAQDLSDAVRILLYPILGRREPACLKSADTDGSGAIDLTDAVGLLEFLFLGGLRPDPPFPACGRDRASDALTRLGDSGCRVPGS
jgi:hypothetical protein